MAIDIAFADLAVMAQREAIDIAFSDLAVMADRMQIDIAFADLAVMADPASAAPRRRMSGFVN